MMIDDYERIGISISRQRGVSVEKFNLAGDSKTLDASCYEV